VPAVVHKVEFYIRRSQLNKHAYLFFVFFAGLGLFELINPLCCGCVLRGLGT
jgi:hypothetical protein